MPPLERHASNFLAPFSTPDSLKRRRIESTDARPAQPVELRSKHKELWYEDGNIVIVTDSMLFRVHRSILSRHSSVFADMFSFPQPQDLDIIHGCPIVQLFDNVRDITAILSPLYDTQLLAAPTINFDVVSAWLRLGSKYAIPRLRDEAVSRLISCYPETLTSFWNTQTLTYSRKPRSIIYSDGEEYFAYRLAWTHDLPQIAAVALYKCCQQSISSLKATVHLGCGPLELDRDFLLHYGEGREKLLEHKITWSLAFLNSDVTQKCREQACEMARIGMIVELHQSGMMRHPDALTDHRRMVRRSGLCPECISQLQDIHMEGLQGVWDDLEKCFGILRWERDMERDDD